MATSKEELESIQLVNAEKRDLIAQAERKAAIMREMLENDTIRDGLLRESDRLDSEFKKVEAEISHLEQVSGVDASSIKVPAAKISKSSLRASASERTAKTADPNGDASAKKTTESDSAAADVSTSGKRAQK